MIIYLHPITSYQVIDTWFLDMEKEWEPVGTGVKYLNHKITDSSPDDEQVVEVTVQLSSEMLDDIDVAESPRFNNLWNGYMNAIITEGVCYVHDQVDDNLRESLRRGNLELFLSPPA